MQPDYYVHCLKLKIHKVQLKSDKPNHLSSASLSLIPLDVDYLICNPMNTSDGGPSASSNFNSMEKVSIASEQQTVFGANTAYTQYQYLLPIHLCEILMTRKKKFNSSWSALGHSSVTQVILVAHDSSDANQFYYNAASKPLQQFVETNASLYAKNNVRLYCMHMPHLIATEPCAGAIVLYPIIANETAIGQTLTAAAVTSYYDRIKLQEQEVSNNQEMQTYNE